jgi:uncharacterized coiled-coil protein SlyX
MIDRLARERIQALEERGVQRDNEIAELSARVSRGAADTARLTATLEALQSKIPALETPPAASDSGGQAVPPTSFPPPQKPPRIAPRTPLPAAALPLPPAPAGFASLIVADFPALFAEFRGKSFKLLWRGSRDGFGALDFHGRCDGHKNTLTLIQDTEGNIFGGFTPVKWELRTGWKADPSLKSFLFTLKNPHNFPGAKFALKAKEKDQAIICDSSCGPHFCDIGVSGNCNQNTDSYADYFGHSYANDTGLDGQTFFTGSREFTVKEIEMFEIAD